VPDYNAPANARGPPRPNIHRDDPAHFAPPSSTATRRFRDERLRLEIRSQQESTMAQGTHEFVDDPRNAAIQIYVNGELKARNEAVVSVFDSGFVLGDGVWEGLRVHAGRVAFLDQHLDRLYEGAKAIDMDIGLDRDALTRALYRTLAANGMSDHAHARLMVTRGVKRTPYQDPRMTIGPATIVIIPEYKNPKP
jgi:branched-chain amino acid aminotransferase